MEDSSEGLESENSGLERIMDFNSFKERAFDFLKKNAAGIIYSGAAGLLFGALEGISQTSYGSSAYAQAGIPVIVSAVSSIENRNGLGAFLGRIPLNVAAYDAGYVVSKSVYSLLVKRLGG